MAGGSQPLSHVHLRPVAAAHEAFERHQVVLTCLEWSLAHEILRGVHTAACTNLATQIAEQVAHPSSLVSDTVDL